jgi:aspartate/methionine/tyrosine aminotransferase
MLYEPIAISLNRCPVHLSTSEKRHFILDVNQIRDHLTQKARLLILNSPENPTGAVYNNSTLTDILLLAQEHGFYVMHDEVFDCHVYDGVHIPALSIFPDSEQIVMVNSFSKRFGMTGWRLGWFISAPDIVTQATKAHTYISLATGTLIQEVATQILNDKEVDRFVYENALTLSKRRHHFMNELLSIEGFTCPSGLPAGGFYFFMDIKELYRKISPSHTKTESISEEVVRYLLQNCKIAVVPGTAFGPSGEGYVRISFAGSENHLKEAVCRLNRIVS